jgi:hypothetical protein
MGATTYEADSSHVPMLSKPRLVIEAIRTAAANAPTMRGSGQGYGAAKGDEGHAGAH